MEIRAIIPLALLGKHVEVTQTLSPASYSYPGNLTIGTSHVAYSENEMQNTCTLGSTSSQAMLCLLLRGLWHTDASKDRGNKLNLYLEVIWRHHLLLKAH